MKSTFARMTVLGLSLLCMRAFGSETVGTLEHELALAKRAGMPTTPAQMARHLPDSQNAAPLYRQLDQWFHKQSVHPEEPESGSLLARMRPDAAAIEKGHAKAKRLAPAYQLVHAAALRPHCDFATNWALGAAVAFPVFARLREAARMLNDESGLLLWDGKPVDAARNLRGGFALARHCDEEGSVIAHLVAVAIQAITMRGLENILYNAGDRPGVAIAVREIVEKAYVPASLSHAMRAELVMDLAAMGQVRKGGPQALQNLLGGAGPVQPPLTALTPSQRQAFYRQVDSETAAIVHGIRRAYLAGDLAHAESAKVYRELAAWAESKPHQNTAVEVIMPVNGPLPDKRALTMARADALRSAAAALQWKVSRGRFPDRLEQALSPAPVDPFDSKPIRYRRIKDGFIVWSVGAKGKFGGLTASQRDYALQAVFRWPMPEVLKHPAVSPTGR